MQVGIAYIEPGQQIWLNIEVPNEATVQQVIEQSGVLQRFSHLDLSVQKVGIFGKLVKLDASPKPGDRIEIYRPITADPATIPRRDQSNDDIV